MIFLSYFLFFSHKRHPLNGNIWALGKIEMTALNVEEARLISEVYGETLKSISTFKRLQRDGEIYFCQKYTRVKVRNSYTVAYSKSGSFHYGQILYFICCKNTAAAVIRGLNQSDIPEVFLPTKSIIPVDISSEIDVVHADHIVEKCVLVTVSPETMYVVRFPCNVNID